MDDVMVRTRVNQLPEKNLVATVNELDDQLRELRVGRQFAEAKLYEYASGSSYDLTGSLSSSAGAYQTLATLLITATSVDGAAFISTCTPELFIPNLSSLYIDTLASNYQVTQNQIITDDPTKTQYWITISARNAVGASTFYLKTHIYSTVPMTVTHARIL